MCLLTAPPYNTYLHIYIYKYTHIHTHTYMYMYIYISLSLSLCWLAKLCFAARRQCHMARPSSATNGVCIENSTGLKPRTYKGFVHPNYLKSSGEHPSHEMWLMCSPCIPTLCQLTHVHAYVTAVLKRLLFMAAYMPTSWMSYKRTISLSLSLSLSIYLSMYLSIYLLGKI